MTSLAMFRKAAKKVELRQVWRSAMWIFIKIGRWRCQASRGVEHARLKEERRTGHPHQ